MAKVPSTATLTRLAKHVFGDVKEVPKIVQEGRRAAYSRGGTHSMVLWPFKAALSKLKGKQVIDNAVYNNYLRRLKNADERFGRVLAQHGPKESWFSIKETLPTKKKIKGLPAKVEHEAYSALAPVQKATKFVTPLAAGMYISEKLSPGQVKEGAVMASEDPRALMKRAAETITEHRRRDEAVKLAFLMVEKGKCSPFQNYDEFQQKVASLESKNLEAVREALDMDSDLSDFGKVASDSVGRGASPEMNFFHRLSE